MFSFKLSITDTYSDANCGNYKVYMTTMPCIEDHVIKVIDIDTGKKIDLNEDDLSNLCGNSDYFEMSDFDFDASEVSDFQCQFTDIAIEYNKDVSMFDASTLKDCLECHFESLFSEVFITPYHEGTFFDALTGYIDYIPCAYDDITRYVLNIEE